MVRRIFDTETWIKIGKPGLGSKMFYINSKTGRKVWGRVVEVNYGNKRGVEFKIKKFK